MVVSGGWVVVVYGTVDAGVGLVTVCVVGDGIVVATDPPWMRKVELYMVGKVTDRCAMTI